MAFPEFQLRGLRQYLNVSWVCEDDHRVKWIFGKRRMSPSSSALEDDIYQLRRQLEMLVQSGYSLTSPLVVKISMELDVKINEYMNNLERKP